jgi:hypothetical protein
VARAEPGCTSELAIHKLFRAIRNSRGATYFQVTDGKTEPPRCFTSLRAGGHNVAKGCVRPHDLISTAHKPISLVIVTRPKDSWRCSVPASFGVVDDDVACRIPQEKGKTLRVNTGLLSSEVQKERPRHKRTRHLKSDSHEEEDNDADGCVPAVLL